MMDEREVASAAARRSAKMRQRVSSQCAVCGASIEGVRQRKYCSNTCGVRALRRRKRAGQRATHAPRVGAHDEGTESTAVPLLVARLNATRAAIMRGRRFDVDSVSLIRNDRDGRMDEL